MKFFGTLLAAEHPAPRTRKHLLLPYGEPGRTNIGTVIAKPGRLKVPGGALPVNMQHKGGAKVGYMTAAETDAGLVSETTFFDTPEGEEALAEVDSGKRPGISVETENTIVKDGELIGGDLVAAGLVEKPAFPSALMTAADTDETQIDHAAAAAAHGASNTNETTGTASAAGTTMTGSHAGKEPQVTVTNTKPSLSEHLLNQLAAQGNPTMHAAEANKDGLSLAKFTSALFGLRSSNDPRTMHAALDVMTQADILDPTSVPQYIGETWKGRHRPDIYTPLLDSAALTALTVIGWRIVKKPTFDDWDPAFTGTAPNEQMTEIHSNEVTFEPTTEVAKRLARGQRFDRAIDDFPNPEAMAVFLREETQALSDLFEAKSKAFILANAKSVTATGADKTDAWAKLIFGMANVLEYSTPTYAIIGNDLWRSLQNTPQIDARQYLAAQLGLEEGQLQGFKLQPARLTDTAMNGRIIVGAKPALKLWTPPGAPIRVDALAVQSGAIDKAVYSYYLYQADPDGITTGGTVEVKEGA